jgi:ribonuclease Z
MIWDRRRKLREEYLGLPGERIRDLRLSGVEVTDEVRVPLVAYLGDSDPRAFDRCPDLFRAKVLITEVTFFDPHHRRERIHKYGHIHLDDVIERAEAFQNELIIACHFSTRYHDDQIVRFVERRLPERLKSRFQLWI